MTEQLVDCSGGDDFTEAGGIARKLSALGSVLQQQAVERTIIFCNKIDTCRAVENYLARQDRTGAALVPLAVHAAVSPEARQSNLRQFLTPPQPGQPRQALVCTDRCAPDSRALVCGPVIGGAVAALLLAALLLEALLFTARRSPARTGETRQLKLRLLLTPPQLVEPCARLHRLSPCPTKLATTVTNAQRETCATAETRHRDRPSQRDACAACRAAWRAWRTSFFLTSRRAPSQRDACAGCRAASTRRMLDLILQF